MSEQPSVVPEELDPQDFELINWTEISKRGLLERINREIMHPIGLAVCRDIDTGLSEGALVSPDGKWVYAEDVDGTREAPEDPVQKLLETIDIKAQAGLCQFSHGGTRAFLKDIRALIAETPIRTPSNGGRAKELAIHLRDQARIFREEDPQARGAAALEEAAGILESLR